MNDTPKNPSKMKYSPNPKKHARKLSKLFPEKCEVTLKKFDL
jgi:hypothetical protein